MQSMTISPSLPLLKFPLRCNLAFRCRFNSMRLNSSSSIQSSLKNSAALSLSLSFPSSKVSPWSGAPLLVSDSGKTAFEARAASVVPESAGEDGSAGGLKETHGLDAPFNHLEIHEKDLESEDSLWDLYERWMSRYQVTRGPEEKKERFKVFKQTVEFVYRTNQLGMPHKVGLNPFSDLTKEEFLKGYTMEEFVKRCGGVKRFIDAS